MYRPTDQLSHPLQGNWLQQLQQLKSEVHMVCLNDKVAFIEGKESSTLVNLGALLAT